MTVAGHAVVWLVPRFRCGHCICCRCMKRTLPSKCPACQQHCKDTEFGVVTTEFPPPPLASAAGAPDGEENVTSRAEMGAELAKLQTKARSAKVRAILAKLHQIRGAKPQAKVVVFTQWGGMRECIAQALREDQIGFCELPMTPGLGQTRTSRDPPNADAEVFLTSLRWTAVKAKVEMLSAHYILFADVCVAADLLAQAQEGCCGLEQVDAMTIVTFVLEGSVEEELHRRLEKKDPVLEFNALQELFGMQDHCET